MILSGRVVTVSRTRLHYGLNALQDLQKFLALPEYRKSCVFILVDNNTGKYCLPGLVKACPGLDSGSLFEIEEGETSKSLSTAGKIWSELLTARADRKSLLINLGGGVVTDLGGFVAASFKRGISYINVPTSLLGMVDAAIGGKSGVNLQHVKNQVGFFYSPAAVFIDPRFLQTLPEAHLRSGFAEVIKSALVGDTVLWRKLLKHGPGNILAMDTSGRFWDDMIMKTVTFKNRIVSRDFRERKLRKVLNFGHTIGHALESFILGRDDINMLHGDAVALGMIAETWLSQFKAGLGEAEATGITSFLRAGYKAQIDALKDSAKSSTSSYDRIFELLLHDKKNIEGLVRFTMLQATGKPRINMPAGHDEILAALDKLFE